MSTIQISASSVQKLRQETGAGMMDCKKALAEAGGDFEAAVDYLRKKGAKVAASRQDRDSKEGIVLAKTSPDGTKGLIVELNCETDFVGRNADFINLANALVDLAMNDQPASIEELLSLTLHGTKVSDVILDQIGKIGEKISISTYEMVKGEKVIAYNHGHRLGVLVAFNINVPNVEEAGKDVAMQIASMNPVAIDKDDVDARTIERELEIAKEQIRAEGKPEAMVEKISLGKLNKFYKDATLLNQEFVKDHSKTIAQFLNDTQKGLTVTAFKRVQLGA